MHKSIKYLIVFVSTFVIEIGSTFYIQMVSENSQWMVFFAFIGPFLSLPFVGFMIETKSWKDRILLALCQALGYSSGSMSVYLYSNFEDITFYFQL